MARVAKERRERRQARLERQRAWLESLWGSDFGRERMAFLTTLRLKRGMPRQLRRMVLVARKAATLPLVGGEFRIMTLDGAREWKQDGDPITDIQKAIEASC